jgi:hypothetical protein
MEDVIMRIHSPDKVSEELDLNRFLGKIPSE